RLEIMTGQERRYVGNGNIVKIRYIDQRRNGNNGNDKNPQPMEKHPQKINNGERRRKSGQKYGDSLASIIQLSEDLHGKTEHEL
ncbi:MAG: hypothetical protein AAB906_02835, partial [Patescibacteria group bacterium]